MIIKYDVPNDWARYDFLEVANELLSAKAALIALTQIPYQRSWADELQRIQLKREVAGTSRIEGAEFTEGELDEAMQETPVQLETRSQKQAAAAVSTYRWIAELSEGLPVNEELILEIHRRLVQGCDDDHCAPGILRGPDQNVTFGAPRHRGVEGGKQCQEAFRGLSEAVRNVFPRHDPLIQALALHYHFAAMHPFLDGNGRTARALEALMLQRVGLRDTLFIAMSNYYYEEKTAYLTALNEARSRNHDLTPFLKFSLKGIETQCTKLFSEIRQQVAKALYRNTFTDLFGRLKSPRKRVMSARNVQVLNVMLDGGELSFIDLYSKCRQFYTVKNPQKAFIRDLNYLLNLQAIQVSAEGDGSKTKLKVNIDWPRQITETEFFKRAMEMPKGKVFSFLST
ncbi:MAG: Fic family protein [Desulfovibrio sp.]|nr:Fic family protein [Desulfovibrio sp.]MBI4958729.1 Fic family protein [Desulfovibrio sp.]